MVVNIACGLDTRCYRMQGYQHWYNLDLPETMAVREKLLPESGTISQIAMSAMEDWGGKSANQNVPVLIVIEGLTMYLNANGRAANFRSDCQPFFACHYIGGNDESCDGAATSRKNPLTEATQNSHWGIKNGKALADCCRVFGWWRNTA